MPLQWRRTGLIDAMFKHGRPHRHQHAEQRLCNYNLHYTTLHSTAPANTSRTSQTQLQQQFTATKQNAQCTRTSTITCTKHSRYVRSTALTHSTKHVHTRVMTLLFKPLGKRCECKCWVTNKSITEGIACIMHELFDLGCACSWFAFAKHASGRELQLQARNAVRIARFIIDYALEI